MICLESVYIFHIRYKPYLLLPLVSLFRLYRTARNPSLQDIVEVGGVWDGSYFFGKPTDPNFYTN